MTTRIQPDNAGAAGVPAAPWRDKKRHLWLLGLIIPTMLLVVLPIVWALNQVGWHTASQALF